MKMMIKRMTIGGGVFIGHVALFTLLYYGRRQEVWLCDSDAFLFGFPLFVAVLAYAALLSPIVTVRKIWQKVALVALADACLAGASAVAGMSVAFMMMGT